MIILFENNKDKRKRTLVIMFVSSPILKIKKIKMKSGRRFRYEEEKKGRKQQG